MACLEMAGKDAGTRVGRWVRTPGWSSCHLSTGELVSNPAEVVRTGDDVEATVCDRVLIEGHHQSSTDHPGLTRTVDRAVAQRPRFCILSSQVGLHICDGQLLCVYR